MTSAPTRVNFSFLIQADPFLVKHTGERVVVGITCSLSILGSLLIVLSYVCFKSMRSKTRQILVHLSLMDLGVALTNLIGDAVYFDQYLYYPDPGTNVDAINALCKTQAFFAAYFTYGSLLWTVSLAVYLYFLIMEGGTNLPIRFLRFSYFFCYGPPVLLSLWLVLTGRLGYAPYNSTGWCSLILKHPGSGEVDFYAAIFGSDLWFYLATVMIVLLYLAARMNVYHQLPSASKHTSANQLSRAVQNVDYKFLLIPVAFVVLRMWTCIVNIVYIYAQVQPSDVPMWLDRTMVYLAGIGDSGQGFANAILFVVFTKKVRQHFLRCLCCKKVYPVMQQNVGYGSVSDLMGDSSASAGQKMLLVESVENSYTAIHVHVSEKLSDVSQTS